MGFPPHGSSPILMKFEGSNEFLGSNGPTVLATSWFEMYQHWSLVISCSRLGRYLTWLINCVQRCSSCHLNKFLKENQLHWWKIRVCTYSGGWPGVNISVWLDDYYQVYETSRFQELRGTWISMRSYPLPLGGLQAVKPINQSLTVHQVRVIGIIGVNMKN